MNGLYALNELFAINAFSARKSHFTAASGALLLMGYDTLLYITTVSNMELSNANRLTSWWPVRFRRHDRRFASRRWTHDYVPTTRSNFFFRGVSRAAHLEWETLEAHVEGTLERTAGVTQFTRYLTRAVLTVKPTVDTAKAKELLERAEKLCLVANSLRGERLLETTVNVREA